MYRILGLVSAVAIFAGGFFVVFSKDNNFEIVYKALTQPVLSVPASNTPLDLNADLPNQASLSNPPKDVKAVYATSWSSGSTAKMKSLIDLIKKTELNSIVIDIKDYTGFISYDIKLPDVVKYKAKDIRIPKINSLIKRLHDENIYVIGRVTVFQDPVLAKARPDLAVKNKKTKETWKDNKGIAWLDPGNEEVWKYVVSIANDALGRGFDEINFDYIRFPSDGDLSAMEFPSLKGKDVSKNQIIREFFSYLRRSMLGARISADLFGLATINSDDLGIGQIIEHAYENFDYVAPMIYPSHYASGFNGHKNPAEHPYEVIKHSMDSAIRRLRAYDKKVMDSEVVILNRAKLRPWLQDFSLGATYDAAKVKAQIRAVYDASIEDCPKPDVGPESCSSLVQGWMLWDPKNHYTAAALASE